MITRVRLVTYKRLAVFFGMSAGLSLLFFFRAVFFGPSRPLQWAIRGGWVACGVVALLDFASYFGVGRWGKELAEAARADERDKWRDRP